MEYIIEILPTFDCDVSLSGGKKRKAKEREIFLNDPIDDGKQINYAQKKDEKQVRAKQNRDLFYEPILQVVLKYNLISFKISIRAKIEGLKNYENYLQNFVHRWLYSRYKISYTKCNLLYFSMETAWILVKNNLSNLN